MRAEFPGLKELPNGKWEVRVPYRDALGRSHEYGGTTYRNRTEALRDWTKFRKMRDEGYNASSGNMTVQQLVEEYIESRKATCRQSTIEAYQRQAKNWVYPYVGRMKLLKLKTAHLTVLYNSTLPGRGLEPGSINAARALIHAALKYAVEMEYRPFNVADKVKTPKRPKTRTRMLTAGELRCVLEAAFKHNPSYALMLQFYASTGARAGELCSVRWRDIEIDEDRQGGWLTIVTHASREKGGVRERPGTKTSDEGRPDIELHARDIDVILRQRMLLDQRAEREGWARTDDDYVWPGRPHTKPSSPGPISQFFKMVTRECGIEDTHLHGLRHRHVSWLGEDGRLTLPEMSRRTGMSIPVMESTYMHPTGSRIRKMAGYVDRGLDWDIPTTLELPAAGETTAT